MERFLGKYSSCLYATLRIIAGLMFALHGSQSSLLGRAVMPPCRWLRSWVSPG